MFSTKSCMDHWDFGSLELFLLKGIGLESLESLVALITMPFDLDLGLASIKAFVDWV